MCVRPSFHDLTPAQQAQFGNGVGAYWMPDALRRMITQGASWFFEEASWRHHDFGYALGGDRWDRARCDWKFLRAMTRDAVSQDHCAALRLLSIPTALTLSALFYVAVRIGGGFGSFNYTHRHCRTVAEQVGNNRRK